MLDEGALRRPGFDPAASAAVRLPHGGTWYLPKPVLFLRPVFKGGRRTDEARLASDDPELDRLKAEVSAAAQDDAKDVGAAVTDLVAYMLLENYDLSDDQLGEIFEDRIEGGAIDLSWMNEAMAVAHARAPKTSPGGES